MSLFERDLLRRLIRQLGEIAARIAGLSTQRKFDEAEALLRQIEGELLGPLTATLDQVDIRTVLLLLGSDDKIGACAVLWSERAKLLSARGEPQSARVLATRSLELLDALEARAGLTSELLLNARSAMRELVTPEPRTG